MDNLFYIDTYELGLRDIYLTPLFLFIIYFIAYNIKQTKYKNSHLKKYFIPALTVKIVGSICAILIYQFYYGPESSDTFGYYKASKDIWNAFIDSPRIAFKILISKAGTYDPETYPYVVDMWGNYRNSHTFFVSRIGGIIGLFTFGTFTPITIVMAFFAFLTSWKFYELFVELYPELYQNLAIAILFLPSVFFWGSGLFKDTITFGSLAMLTYASYYIFIKKKQTLILWIILFISIYTIMQIKIYILLCFLFPLIIWIALAYRKLIYSPFFRVLITPVIILITIIMVYFIINEIGDTSRYSFDSVINTSQKFQNWHHATKSGSGSSYSLGEIDFSTFGIIKKIPSAINVTLFRPYIWEVNNIVMLLAAIESVFIFFLTLYVLFKCGLFKSIKTIYNDSFLSLCIIFSLLFAFAVGFSSYNFGALVRYKIPCLPFYVAGLFIIIHKIKKEKKEKSLNPY